MDAFITYTLKLNMVLSVLYLVYWFFLRTLSFYKLTRLYFIISILCAFCLPLVKISSRAAAPQAILYVSHINLPTAGGKAITGVKAVAAGFNDFYIAFQYCLLAGMAAFALLLVVRIITLFRFLKATRLKNCSQGLQVRVSDDDTAPFSFWNIIVIRSSLVDQEETACIIAHEKVHVRQLHSADILLKEICKLFCWFNPVYWLFNRALRQNLEYIADAEVLEQGHDQQHYQLCLLQVNMGKKPVLPVLPFNAASFKLRLFQMNREQSSAQIHTLKYFSLLPVIAVALLMNADFYSSPVKSSFNAVNKIAGSLLRGQPAAAGSALPVQGLKSSPAAKRNIPAKPNVPVAEKQVILPVQTTGPESRVPEGATWHAKMSSRSIDVTINGTVLNIAGDEGFAEIDNRETTYPHKINLVNFPDAILFYKGKEYPLNEFETAIDPTHIVQTKVYLGKAATDIFGNKGKKGIVLAWSSEP